MPLSILSSVSSKPSLSIVNASTQFDIASGLAVSKVSVRFHSKLFRHIREDGQSVVDARVLMPIEVDAEVIAKTIDQLTNLNNALRDRWTTYRIYTKGINVPLVMMDGEELKQEPGVLSGAPLKVSFKSILYSGGSNAFVCEQGGDSSLMKRGLTYLSAATIDISTLASRIGFSF